MNVHVQCTLYSIKYLIYIISSSADEVNEININDPVEIPEAAKSKLFM